MKNLTQLIRENLPTEGTTIKPVMCLGCYHVWVPQKVTPPKKCPACMNYDWDKPRVLPKRKKDAKLNMSPRATALISALMDNEQTDG